MVRTGAFIVRGAFNPWSGNQNPKSLPGSSVHGILQARTLDWIAMCSSRVSSWPRDQTQVSCGSCIAGRFFTTEPPEILHFNSFKRHLLSTYYERSSSLLVLTSLWTQAKLKSLKMIRQLEKRLRQENGTFIYRLNVLKDRSTPS